MKWLVFVLFTSSAWAFDLPKTSVAFMDQCSGKQTGLTTPNGTRLIVLLEELNPQLSLEVRVTWRPAGLMDDLSRKNSVEHSYRRAAFGGNGRTVGRDGEVYMELALPKAEWMYQVEQKHQTSRLWTADVLWWQEGGKSGSESSTIARMLPGQTSFYQIMGPRECAWESGASVSSKSFENPIDDFMNITREYQQQWSSNWMHGTTAGPSNQMGGTAPLLPVIGSNYGWLFADWQKQYSHEQFFEFERKWVLRREDFGVFAKRFSHSRLPVKRWQWVQPENACGKWQAIESGKIDVGIEVEDFYVIPKSAYGDPQVTAQNIDLIHPPLNTCPAHVGRGPEHATLVTPNGYTGLIYFYPDQRVHL
jgi:hypothetical protein